MKHAWLCFNSKVEMLDFKSSLAQKMCYWILKKPKLICLQSQIGFANKVISSLRWYAISQKLELFRQNQ